MLTGRMCTVINYKDPYGLEITYHIAQGNKRSAEAMKWITICELKHGNVTVFELPEDNNAEDQMLEKMRKRYEE